MVDPTKANHLFDNTLLFGDITGTFTSFGHDLGVNVIYKGLMIYSTLDRDVIIQLPNTDLNNKMTIPAGPWEEVPDNFWHNGDLKIKHPGVAPTFGFIKIVSYRGIR